jgi:DNA helicase II / ATP-dependent DNA helicase PcrA
VNLLTATEQERIDRQGALAQWVRETWPGATQYFGHMRLRTDVREVDLLLGNVTQAGRAERVLLDWQSAPLAEVYFTHDEGEDYELELPDRTVTGHVLEKNLLFFEGGRLQRVEANGRSYSHTEEGWRAEPAILAPSMGLRPAPQRRGFRSPLEVELDATQRRAVELPRGTSLLLLGEAGFGKTTVALHRLVRLREQAGRRYRAAVIVPTEGLSHLTQVMLERRRIGDIDVWTYDQFAARAARRIFGDLPRRQSSNTPSPVVRLKRHPALAEVLRRFVQKNPKPARDEEHPKHLRALASRGDLELLFGDKAWMEQVVAASEGALSSRVVEQVAVHTRMQFSESSEHTHAHVRADSLETVDGRRIDEGTPMEDANSIDVEDFAVLFQLERLRAAAHRVPSATPGRYDCLVIDEAQELAPLELALLGRSLKSGGTLIVAGDAAQQVDATTAFTGWDAALSSLEAADAERVVLEVNYRCPPDVTALARHVLDSARPLPHQEPSITRVAFPSRFHLAVYLLEELTRLTTEDPSAAVTVICRTADAARAFARVLRHGPPPKLALEGRFDFRPGVTVSCVQEVKGLEFDYVVVPDASWATYPDTAESRRSLYVAVTRATHRLVLASTGSWTPLV